MVLDNSVDHCQSKACSFARTFCSEKGLEDALLRLLIHTAAGIH